MAPLTWRNVDAPDLTRASQILNSAVANWAGGFQSAGDTLMEVRERQKLNRSAEAFPWMANITNENDAGSVLSRIAGSISARDMTPELQEAMMSLRERGLSLDSSRTSLAASRAASGRAAAAASRDAAERAALAAVTPDILRMNQDAFVNGESGIRLGGASEAPASVFSNIPVIGGIADRVQSALGAFTGEAPQTTQGTPAFLDYATLAENNKDIPLETWMKLVGDGYGNFNTARENSNSDRASDLDATVMGQGIRDTDYTFDRRVSEDRLKDRATQIGRESLESVLSLAPEVASFDEAIEIIMGDKGLSGEEKVARVNAIREFSTSNPEYFTPNASVRSKPADVVIAEQIAADAQFNNMTDPAFRSLNLLGASSGSSAPEAVAKANQNAAEQLAGLREAMGDGDNPVELGNTDSDIMDVVQKVARDYRIGPDVVMSLVGNSLSGRLAGGGKIYVNESMVRDALSAVGSREEFQQAYAAQLVQNQRVSRATELIDQIDTLSAQAGMFASRNTPGAKAQAARLETRVEALRNELRTLGEQNARTNPVASRGEKGSNPVLTALSTFANNVASNLGSRVPQTPATPTGVTPNGNFVDPSASSAMQDYQRHMIRGEINSELSRIKADLGIKGGALGSRFIGNVSDYFFKSPAEAEIASKAREVNSEALSWYDSPEAYALFAADPGKLLDAKADPVTFWMQNK